MAGRGRAQGTRKTAVMEDVPVVALEPPAPVPVPDTAETNVLLEYVDHDGLVPVVILVSHDDVFEGQHLRVPPSARLAGLIGKGFIDVDHEAM